MKQIRKYSSGSASGWMIATFGLLVGFLAAGSLAIWAYINYNEQKTDVDSKVELARVEAAKEQSDKDAKEFFEKEKEPNREFASPDDYGRVSFSYPKTWSAYIESDPASSGSSSRGDYIAYLHPVVVPPIKSSGQQYALRLRILNRNYDQYLSTMSRGVESGEIRSSVISVNGESAMRFDGAIERDIRGSQVVFKLRDKTVVLQTDADIFKNDFNNLIKTIKFVK